MPWVVSVVETTIAGTDYRYTDHPGLDSKLKYSIEKLLNPEYMQDRAAPGGLDDDIYADGDGDRAGRSDKKEMEKKSNLAMNVVIFDLSRLVSGVLKKLVCRGRDDDAGAEDDGTEEATYKVSKSNSVDYRPESESHLKKEEKTLERHQRRLASSRFFQQLREEAVESGERVREIHGDGVSFEDRGGQEEWENREAARIKKKMDERTK